MIKVFTTGKGPGDADEILNRRIEKWLETQPSTIKITNIHTNSNQYGWMVVVQYELH